MDEVSLNTEPIDNDDGDEFEIEGGCGMTEFVCQPGVIQGDNPLPPAIGMEFESYEDVYYFYNCYAKDQGFGVRVSNTWYRKSKERYRGKLSCSSAGFKKKSDANRPRPETRTGCPAMIKFRLMDNKRWRIIEVELEHNHLTSPVSGKFYKSHKVIGAGTKRTLQLDSPDEVQKVKLYRTVIVDAEGNGSIDDDEGKFANHFHLSQLKLKDGDAQAVQNFFCHLQLLDPDFFYVVDINERGYMRNLFWADGRSRVAYGYFGDVITIDTTSLKDKFQVPLVSFFGVNHHEQPLLLGCGLLAGETLESFVWLLRAWLTCMLGRPPQAVITRLCTDLQAAVADVFPRASHCLSLPHILQNVLEQLGGLYEFEAIKVALSRTVYYSLRPEDFEAAWEEMLQQHHDIRDNKWIQSLYEDRRKWVPAYVKEAFLAGLFPFHQNEILPSVFERYLGKHSSLKEFLCKYEAALQTNHQLEALADAESRNSSFGTKSRSYFELQLSKLYTNKMLRRFAEEVEGMCACFSARQVSFDGPLVTYIVKEQIDLDGNRQETRDFEVMYNASEMDILCVCGLFNFRGYLCRHALSVLNQNGLDKIPSQYILTRWRKDVKRSYVLDHTPGGVDINNPVHRYDHLYKSIVRVVGEGRKSENRYKVTLQALEEILNKLQLVED